MIMKMKKTNRIETDPTTTQKNGPVSEKSPA